MSTRAPQRRSSEPKTASEEGSSLLKGFRLDTTSGRGEFITLILVFLGPILAFFVSTWFLLVLVAALAASLVTIPRVARARGEQVSRVAQAGLAMTVNGALLFLSMIVIGFIDDFVYHGREGFRGSTVAGILTVVHILLGVGLQVWDTFKD